MSTLIKKLSAETGLLEYQVERIVLNAPERYKHYRIKKKNGGYRNISQPAKELKLIQRSFTSLFLLDFPVHEAAKAYRHGISIRDNAFAHKDNSAILKMDFKDFFPSITSQDWLTFCNKRRIFNDPQERHLSANILFHRPWRSHKLRLAIGAPSSPHLSNILLYEFDQKIAEIVAEEEVVYTRYADDLTFSAPRTGHLTSIPRSVSKVLNSLTTPVLKINRQKTVRITKKFGRRITGLTITNDQEVTIGRYRKRLIRAQIHHFVRGKMDTVELKKLAGLISFSKSAEPSFYQYLLKSYGERLISEILKSSGTKR